jgi:3'(2'), 5'-bisphosphate nucleotidase
LENLVLFGGIMLEQTSEIKFAIHAVSQAALLVKQIQRDLDPAAITKGDLSPVTVADFASQALVGRLLAESFPEDVLVAEEDSAALKKTEGAEALRQVTQALAHSYPGASPEQVCAWIDRGAGETAGRFWTLDPIDGTKGFLRGDQYAVALALIESGQVQIGLLGCPNLTDGYHLDPGGPGSLVVAARGQGTWVSALESLGDFIRLRVSDQHDPAKARLMRSFESGHTNTGQIDELAVGLDVKAEPVRMDSQAKYAVLAAGKGDLLLRLLSPAKPDYREKIWDQAAGSLIVEEAGGQVTDLHGADLEFSHGRTLAANRGILASNGLLHASALGALVSIGA